MAELNVGTLQMIITADGSAAIRELDRVDQTAGRMTGNVANEMRGAGDGIADAFEGAAEAAEDAGRAGAEAGEKAAEGAKKAHKSIKEVGETMSRIGEKATKFVTLPVVAAFTASVKGASDLVETVGKTEVVFDRMSDKVMGWSENSVRAMGLAQGSALEYASTFGDMGKGMGLTLDTATEMSMNLTQLAADLASFKNIRTDVAAQKLNAVYTGETEGLKSLGIVMTQTNLQAFALSQGITKQVSAMSQAELVMLRYKYVMSVTKDAQGDFERTGGSLANQTRKLTETLKQAGESFGSLLIPMITPVVQKLQEWIQHIAELDQRTKNIIISVAAVAAAVGPLLLVGGKLLTFLATLKASLAALSINPVLLAIGAAAAAGAAIYGINKALNKAQGEVDETSGAYNRMKAAVEKGATGKVSIDSTELDNLETKKEITITANGRAALDAAGDVIAELKSEKYKGMIAIDGDPEKAEAVLDEVAADIRAVKESVTIDGDGNAVIGDGGLVEKIKADIAKLEGLVVITEDPTAKRALQARINALKTQLTGIVGNVQFKVPDGDRKALETFRKELEALPKDEKFQGFGKFKYEQNERKNLDDFNRAMMEAAGKVGNFKEAVDEMNQAVDADLQEDIKQVLDQTNQQIDLLTAVYKGGGLSYDQYIAAIQEEIDAKDAEISRLKEQAKAQKDVNARLANGTEKDDAETVGATKIEQFEKGLVDTKVSKETTASALSVIEQAADKNTAQMEGMTALLGLEQEAEAQQQALTQAVQDYQSARADADQLDQQAEGLEKQAEGYKTASDMVDLYTGAIASAKGPATAMLGVLYQLGGEDAVGAYNQAMAEGASAADAFAAATANLGDSIDPDALAVLGEALTDESGNLANYQAALESTAGLQKLESEASLEAADTHEKAEEARVKANEELLTSLSELQEGVLSSEGKEGALIEIGKTGVDISGAKAELVTGVPAAVEEAYAAAQAAVDNGTDPAEAMAAAVEKSAALVTNAAKGAADSAAKDAGATASADGEKIGDNMADGVARGIKNKISQVAEQARQMVREAMNAAKKEGEIASPSKKADREIGQMLPAGVGRGIEKATPKVVQVMRRSTEKLISGAAAVARKGGYTVPVAAAPASGINYDAMGSAMEQAMGRVRFAFNVDGRNLAQTQRENNAQQMAVQSSRVSKRYGG